MIELSCLNEIIGLRQPCFPFPGILSIFDMYLVLFLEGMYTAQSYPFVIYAESPMLL